MTTDYDAWHAERNCRAAAALHRLDKLLDKTEAFAREQTARLRTHPTPANREAADDAWALVRARRGPLDALGEPVDPSNAGRAKFERAWLLATGLPYTQPDDDDTTPEHAAGDHRGTTQRRGFTGDLPACDACMDDELWTLTMTYATRTRKAPR